MNESNYGAEFILPEELQKHLDGAVDQLTKLMVGAIIVLYPDGDFPDNAMEEMVSLLIPKVIQAVDKHVDELMGEMEDGD